MTTLTRRPSRYLLIGVLAALISTHLVSTADATPNSLAIAMEIPGYPGKDKLTAGVKNSSVKKCRKL